MSAALTRSDRQRSLVTLAVWSGGFLAVLAVAAWQFGWLPTDEEAARRPPDDDLELAEGSSVPFHTSADRRRSPWHDDEFPDAAGDFAMLPPQSEPHSAPNPTNEQTWRGEPRRARLWDHVRETPPEQGAWPPEGAAPRYSSAAEPAGWLADEHPRHADDYRAPPVPPHRGAPVSQAAAWDEDPRAYSRAHESSRPQAGHAPQAGPPAHAPGARVHYGRVEPAAYEERPAYDERPANGERHAYEQRRDERHAYERHREPHAFPGEAYGREPHSASVAPVRLAGLETIDTGERPAAAPARAAERPIDPVHPAARDIAEIDRLIAEGDIKEAHRRLSTMYWQRPEWRPLFQKRIDQTAESIYFSDLRHFMEPYVVEPGDQLGRIAARYKVSWQYLERLNKTPANRIRPGQRLKVIKGPFAARIDLSDYELTVHAHGWYVRRYRIGIGRDGSTPVGTFTVQEKLVNPTYYRPASEGGGIIAADDPNNPLGEYWIGIGNSYGIHGTIEPESIGRAESRGCIRLLNEDVAEVFDFLVPGSEVVIQP